MEKYKHICEFHTHYSSVVIRRRALHSVRAFDHLDTGAAAVEASAVRVRLMRLFGEGYVLQD